MTGSPLSISSIITTMVPHFFFTMLLLKIIYSSWKSGQLLVNLVECLNNEVVAEWETLNSMSTHEKENLVLPMDYYFGSWFEKHIKVDKGWYCSVVGKAAACNAGISFVCCFVS